MTSNIWTRRAGLGLVVAGLLGLAACNGAAAGGVPADTRGESPAAQQTPGPAATPGTGKGMKGEPRAAEVAGTAEPAAPPRQGSGEAPPAGTPASPGADPARLVIVQGQSGIDDAGFLRIAGTVKNDTGAWLTSVRVTIRLYDAAGEEIGTDSITTEVAKDLGEEPIERVYAERTYVPPGEVAVFQFLRDVKKIKGTYASHALSVRALPAESPPTVSLTGFTAAKNADGHFEISGSIVNSGRVGCRSPKVVLGLYAADGTLLWADYEMPDETFQKILGPGQSVAVPKKPVPQSDLPIASVKGWADCEPPA
ncbi:MAG: hypothetical protein IT373_06595 [Polyangiaceae bacterium]|nr:hypothetical protein [Polyangiaceae bacterium]